MSIDIKAVEESLRKNKYLKEVSAELKIHTFCEIPDSWLSEEGKFYKKMLKGKKK